MGGRVRGAEDGGPTLPDRTPYLTVAEAAHLLRVHPQSVYRMVHAGELPHLRVGRAIRIPREAVDKLARLAASA
jgi:excisionase family DNA binding protein